MLQMEGHRSLIGSLFFNTVLKGRIHLELKTFIQMKEIPTFFLSRTKGKGNNAQSTMSPWGIL